MELVIIGIAVQLLSPVRHMKEIVTVMMSVLVTCYVDQTTASIHLDPMLTAVH